MEQREYSYISLCFCIEFSFAAFYGQSKPNNFGCILTIYSLYHALHTHRCSEKNENYKAEAAIHFSLIDYLRSQLKLALLLDIERVLPNLEQ